MPLSPVQVVQLIEALPVFESVFGPPDSDLALRSRVGALLAVMDGVDLLPAEIEPMIDQVLAVVQGHGQLETGRWVKAARQWLNQQRDQLGELVSAYVQSSARQITDSELVAVAGTAVAVLGDGKLSPSEGRQLTQQLVSSFDLEAALGRAVSPAVMSLAQRVAQYRSKADFEGDVLSIAQAYLQQFGGRLTPALMQRVIQQGTLNLSPETLLSGDWEELGGLDTVARTFMFKMQLLEADPPVTKTAQEIAQQVHASVSEFNRGNRAIDLTQPANGDDNDLLVSSILQPESDD